MDAAAGAREIRLIGVASGLGAPAWAVEACARGPAALRAAGLAAALRRNGHHGDWAALLAPGTGPRAAALTALCRDLADHVAGCIEAGTLPVVVGGDHAIAAGTWRGAARTAGVPMGLLWIDAHLDAHTPATSLTGNPHGMPLAALLGADIPGLDGIAGPPLDPRCLCVVGARSFEEAESLRLRELGVRVFDMREIRRRGLRPVIADALRHVRDVVPAFGISIDLDVIDPRDAPGVSTPSADGIGGGDLCAALRGLGRDPKLVALEIAEYNPGRDPDGRTARLTIALIESLAAHVAATS